MLRGMVDWTDLDPVSPMKAAGLVTLGPRTVDGWYHGHIHLPPVLLGAEIHDNYPTPTADVTLIYSDPFWGYQIWDFPTCPMPLDQPFDTHLLTYVNVPGTDYRKCRFAE